MTNIFQIVVTNNRKCSQVGGIFIEVLELKHSDCVVGLVWLILLNASFVFFSLEMSDCETQVTSKAFCNDLKTGCWVAEKIFTTVFCPTCPLGWGGGGHDS